MSDLVLAGGTVVTAESSFRADVAIDGEKIAAIYIVRNPDKLRHLQAAAEN